MRVSDWHPDPFPTWRECNDFLFQIHRPNLHCEEGP